VGVKLLVCTNSQSEVVETLLAYPVVTGQFHLCIGLWAIPESYRAKVLRCSPSVTDFSLKRFISSSVRESGKTAKRGWSGSAKAGPLKTFIFNKDRWLAFWLLSMQREVATVSQSELRPPAIYTGDLSWQCHLQEARRGQALCFNSSTMQW
jgi:hypothetical protein